MNSSLPPLSTTPESPGPERPVRGRRRWLAIRRSIPGTTPVLAAGTCLGRARLAPVAVAVGAAAVAAGTTLALAGHADWVVDPLANAREPGPALAAIWLSASAALSVRGLARGLALHAMGHGGTRLAVGATCGVFHLDADASARRTAPAGDRAILAASGLVGLTAFFAGAGLAAATGHAGAATATAVGALALFADLCPYQRTDGWSLVSIASRTPRLARHSVRWLLTRRVPPVTGTRSATTLERHLTLVACAWIAHAIAAEAWIVRGLMPGAARLARQTFSVLQVGDWLGFLGALLLLAVLAGAVAAAAAMFAATIIGAAWGAARGGAVAAPAWSAAGSSDSRPSDDGRE